MPDPVRAVVAARPAVYIREPVPLAACRLFEETTLRARLAADASRRLQ
jgi:hypothetical protein